MHVILMIMPRIADLVFWRYEVVYNQHLEPEFPAQLSDVLQESLHFSLMFLL